MTTTTTSISDFVRARLDADEAAARAANTEAIRRAIHDNLSCRVSDILFSARHDPARVLAQVAALRAVVELHGDRHNCPDGDLGIDAQPYDDYNCDTLLHLAGIWASDPAFDPAWAVGA